ncbi:DsbA family protein [Thermasporomyces composti]|jgi:protein-disulfide isomerase|uniref:Protein-disulfide isomerase n=1 Tax=Thermasporomyces composti TaxID=696763 RepID=A0A3D9UYX5_THECX|nr:thioredoxin domain-containing protein [Thermasporomyces composti]REF34742.1 protein-disulfide isomerase [Thermasporomyces composti]
MSKKSAREALRAERARQAAEARRRENRLRLLIALVVVVVVVAIAGVVQWQRSKVDSGSDVPAGVAHGYTRNVQERAKPVGMGNGIAIGKENAPVTVEVFEDFLCPHCRDFEAAVSDYLKEQVDSGKVRVVYYPVTLSSFGRPTELAANAFACAADAGKGPELHDALYTNFRQDWTVDLLTELGSSVGLSDGSFRSCVRRGKFEEWVRSIDQTATDRGVTGTPTVFVNGGEPLQPQDMTAPGLRLVIDDALAKRSGRE